MARFDSTTGSGFPRGRGDLTQGPIARPCSPSRCRRSPLDPSVAERHDQRHLGRPLPRRGALAATSNANMVMFLLTSFVFGFGMASTILIGQAWGRKDVDGARRVFGTATGAFVLITIGDRDRRLDLLCRARSCSCSARRRRGAARARLSCGSSSSPCPRCCC
jgi:hypothetical protein